MMLSKEKIQQYIRESNYLSRDLSWINFNRRVLDQARNPKRNIFDRLKFIAITASNLDEFFTIRVGNLYNYIDYGKEKIDYSGLREEPFKVALLEELKAFLNEQIEFFERDLMPLFAENAFRIVGVKDLDANEKRTIASYFKKTIFPMLTPMVYDSYHAFPILMNKILILGVVTGKSGEKLDKKLSFVQIPQNLPRFYEIEREDEILFLPIEEIVRWHLDKLFRNVDIISNSLFRITRNGDFSLEESEDMEADFIDEVRRKLKTRKTGRVVRLEIEGNYSPWMGKILKRKFQIDDYNVFEMRPLIDFTALYQIIRHKEFASKSFKSPASIPPISGVDMEELDIFQKIKKRDIFLHHPYNSFDYVLELIEKAAEDPNVLAIKQTIYRLSKDSRITNALLKAVEKGKHVSVLFELKARFDEENNIAESQRLQKAGCFVIYGLSNLKTHTKLLLIVRKEEDKIVRYVHMSSGNYNETTAKVYTDIGVLSCKEAYARDITEFFNAITGHSYPESYEQLITAPDFMRHQLKELIQNEIRNAEKGLPCGIVIKVNSLQDQNFIDALYEASQKGVPIQLIIRGVCCLRPARKQLSENIQVFSIVGDFLEHSRLFYFHNNKNPRIYSGSADAMVRSFDRRIESLFEILDERNKQEAITVLAYNLKDNVNSYVLQEDGTFIPKESKGEKPFNIHEEFFKISKEDIKQHQKLF